MKHRIVQNAINQYSIGYKLLEQIQTTGGLGDLPIGDQKTGAIGEYYARVLLEYKFKQAKIRYGTTTQCGWDLCVTMTDGKIIKYQVKTVSAFSKTRRISPIHKGWDILLLISLTQEFRPEAIWEVVKTAELCGKTILNTTMPIPGNTKSGSKIFLKRKDITFEFFSAEKAIGNQYRFSRKELIDLFITAIRNVKHDYYEIHTAGQEILVRERVFCYELYHQLRLILENNSECPLRLHGEIDKRGQSLFSPGDKRNPDFIIHIPKSMKSNLVVVEVKGSIEDLEDLSHDIETLIRFQTDYEYYTGLLIIFGENRNTIRKAIQNALTRRPIGISTVPFISIKDILLLIAENPQNISVCRLNSQEIFKPFQKQ